MLARLPWRVPTIALLLAAAAVFILSWVLRYNDPEGAFGGLTDDHFFYVVQGWQMLFGELPDRDYFDPGAPLTFAVSAALQLLLGRSVWSEYIFCVTALSLGAAMTCVLAARATGSIVLGVMAALFEMALLPRLYNYPKMLVYAVAIATLWAWASAPRTRRTWLLAVVTAVAFLLRHDHGIYVAGAFGVLLLGMRELPWRERVRHGVVYGLATLLLLAPYLIYLQVNGGVERHFVGAYGWSVRDYGRAPLRLPTLSWQPLFEEEPSDAPASEWWNQAPFPALSSYYTWWMYWFIMLLPAVALLLLLVCPSTGPPGWPKERVKILVVAVLLIVLNSRFLRGNLAGRLADVSVPMVILAAWSLAATGRIVRSGRIEVGTRSLMLGGAARGVIAAAALTVVLVTTAILLRPVRELVGNSGLLEGLEQVLSNAERVTQRVQHTWPLDTWGDSGGQVGLSRYLESCTAPTDRVLITPHLPPVVALAQRAFAGGHMDLRAGFFGTVAEQQLTIERLERQSVPVAIGPPGNEIEDYAEDLPLIADYLNREYVNRGDRDLGGGLVFSLLVHRGARSVRTYEPLSFPCFR